MRITNTHDIATSLVLAMGNKPRTVASFSQQLSVSVSYLEQIFSKLRNACLVHAERGPGGGYSLARPHSEITVGDIFTAIGTETKCRGYGLFDEINRRLKNVPLTELAGMSVCTE